jgi:hypothetical protein
MADRGGTPHPFLRDDDFSLASDLARAAVAIGGDVEAGVYKPEHESRYRALALRLHEHALAALQSPAPMEPVAGGVAEVMELARLTQGASQPREGSGLSSPAEQEGEPDVLAIIAKHRRQVEQSPGVGARVQGYAIDCLDDVAAEIQRAALARKRTGEETNG